MKAALIGVGATLLLLLAGTLLAPWLLRDHVVDLVELQIGERLEASVTFERIDLSLPVDDTPPGSRSRAATTTASRTAFAATRSGTSSRRGDPEVGHERRRVRP